MKLLKASKALLIIWFLAFIELGVGFYYGRGHVYITWHALHLKNRAVTQGEIQNHLLKKQVKPSTDGKPRRISYTPIIEYQFTVADKKYQVQDHSTAHFSGFSSTGLDYANQFMEKFPKGSIVPVYYMPEDPYICSLVDRATPRFWVFQILILSLLVGCVGLGIYLFQLGIREFFKAL